VVKEVARFADRMAPREKFRTADRENHFLEQAIDAKARVVTGERLMRCASATQPRGGAPDDRINLTRYRVAALRDGAIAKLTRALAAEGQAEQLAALAEERRAVVGHRRADAWGLP